jgi:hypothetical protein
MVNDPSRLSGKSASVLGGEILVLGATTYGMDGLVHPFLPPAAFLGLWGSLGLARLVAEAWRFRGVSLIRFVLLCLAGFLANQVWVLGLTAGQLAYLAGLGCLLTGLYRVLLRKFGPKDDGREPWRLLSAGAVGFLVVLPFVTENSMGGPDARWYGQMMRDFLAQARDGIFPIFIGQGETAFNGGIHPFRSAPLFLWEGGLLDLITLRGLSVLAILHLTVVVSSVVAALGMYLALVSLVPKARWLAVGVTAVVACCPGQLGAIYAAEAYMTFVALPCVVAVFYGNALSFRAPGAGAWWWLAAGLAMTWFAHPAVAGWASIATACLQAGWLVAHGRARGEWGYMVLAILGGVLLTLYYFTSMSEVPGMAADRSGVMPGLAGGLGFVVAGCWWRARNGGWVVTGLGLGLGIGLLWWTRTSYGVYALVTAVLYLGTLALRRWVAWTARPGRELEWIGGCLLAAAFLAPQLLGKGGYPAPLLDGAREVLPSWLKPVPADAVSRGAMQPGWPLTVLFAGTVVMALRVRDPRCRVFAAVTLFFALLLVPLPNYAEFLWGSLPEQLVPLLSIAFDRRLLPIVIPLVGFAGFLALTSARSTRGWTILVLAAFVPWCGWEAGKYVRRGFSVKATWRSTLHFYRPETTTLGRFPYDLLPMPPYVSDGVMDYRLETRVLNQGDFSVRFGPAEYARLPAGEGRVIDLEAKPADENSAWLVLPPLEIPAGADWILQFEFAPGLPHGVLVMQSLTGLYREYSLPSSGFAKSFGFGPGHHGVISLRNSGPLPEQYNVLYLRQGTFLPAAGTGRFGRLTISPFDSRALPLQVTGLAPYHAQVDLKEAGWLETFRCWLPGYAATVNGRAVEVSCSPSHLVMVPVPAGVSTVEVGYVGTPGLWRALGISGTAWVALLSYGAWRMVKGWPS